jgi:hypothetical protein
LLKTPACLADIDNNRYRMKPALPLPRDIVFNKSLAGDTNKTRGYRVVVYPPPRINRGGRCK